MRAAPAILRLPASTATAPGPATRISVICITLEDGRNYYASAWTMGGESYIWLLLELEECMVWLADGRF